MSFTKEDRKEVFDFWVRILEQYNKPVSCDQIRGYVTQAPPIVKRYVLQKCKGDKFLEYFVKRKNYFIVEKCYVSLKHKKLEMPSEDDYLSDDERSPDLNIKAESKSKMRGKSRSRPNSECSSILSATQEQCEHTSKDEEEREKYEDIAIKYFTEYLKRNKKVKIDLIDVSTLNKKIQRLINKHYGKKLRSFFLSFPSYFSIDDEDVFIQFPKKEAPIRKEEVKSDVIKPVKTNSENIPVEVKKAMNFCASLQFFVNILHQKPSPFPIAKLSGYLSQAAKEIRDYIKFNYRTFTDFFNDTPAIFQVNEQSEVALSSNSNKLLKCIKEHINKAMDTSEVSFKSHIDFLLKQNVQRDTSLATNNSKSVKPIKIEDTYLHIMTEKETLTELKKLQKKASEVPGVLEKESLTGFKQVEMKACQTPDSQHTIMDKFDEIKNTATYEDHEGKLFEFIFCVELYCVSIVESEHFFLDQSEIKTVRYFTEILKKCKICEITSLRGHLGNAADEVLSFMNRYYKNEKFKDFFSKHHTFFTLKYNVVTLALRYEEFMVEEESEIKALEDDCCDVKIIESVYEDSYFKELKIELFAYLYEVANFLRFKDKTKLSRIAEIRLRFSHCNEWIKLMEGESLIKKTSNFLRIFLIFEFFSDDYITFCSNNHSILLMKWLEEMSNLYQIPNANVTPFYLFIQKTREVISSSEYEEIHIKFSQESIYMLNQLAKDHLKNHLFIEYHALPQLLPKTLLKEINACKRDSSAILLSLLNKDLILKKGQIKLNYSDESIDLMKPKTANIANRKDVSNAESISESKTYTQKVNSIETLNLKEHLSCIGQNSTIRKENSIHFSDELLDYLNACKESDNSYDKDIQCERSDVQNVSDKNVSEDSNAQINLNPLHEKELNLKCNNYAENNSTKTELISSLIQNKSEFINSQNTLHMNFNSKLTTKSNSGINITQSNRQKSDSGFEESDFVSEKINSNEYDSRSSSSSFEDNTETTLNLSENLKENSTKHLTSEHSIKKEMSLFQMPASSPGYQNLAPETDSDSCFDDCEGINMYLKECIETPECSASSFLSNREIFLNDSKVAELLSHDECNHLNAYSEANVENLEGHSNENMNKSSKILFENNSKENIDFNSPRILNAKTVNNSNLKQDFSVEHAENHGASFIEICDNNAPCNAEDKPKTRKCLFKENIPPNRNFDAFADEISLTDNDCEENKGHISEMQPYVNYPLQSLLAEIVLLTPNSCIAVTNIDSQMQSIYFLKSVYFCDKHEYCSTCFDLLKIGDKVSCFVPLTEIPQRTWIAFMVSKEKSPDSDRMKYVNEVLGKQMCVDSCLKSIETLDYLHNKSTEPLCKSVRNISSNTDLKSCFVDSINSETMSTEYETPKEQCCSKCKAEYSTFFLQSRDSNLTINSCKEIKDKTFLSSCYNCNKEKIDASCSVSPDVQDYFTQTNYSCADVKCQTLLSGQVKECANTDEIASQTFSSFISSRHVSVQIGIQMIDSGNQTDGSLQYNKSKEVQTDSVESSETCSQTELIGEVKSVMKAVNADSQTISTGTIMITNYYHL